jgi:hypothetical protein
MPTHTPNVGRPAATRSRTGASNPRSTIARTQWPKWPTPGISSASAPDTSAGSAVTSARPPTRAIARETECRLPLP